MYVIDASFESLDRLPVAELLRNPIGVYVLWTLGARARPSYIGEGVVPKRLADHLARFGRGLEGYVALMREGTSVTQESDAKIVERTVLEVGERLGLFPHHNIAPGELAALWRRGARGHSTIRIRVDGYHPLKWNVRLHAAVAVTWRWDDHEGWMLSDIPWRRTSA